MDKKIVREVVYLSEVAAEAIFERAQKDGVSRSSVIAILVEEGLGVQSDNDRSYRTTPLPNTSKRRV